MKKQVLVAWIIVSNRMYKAYRNIIEERLASDEVKGIEERRNVSANSTQPHNRALKKGPGIRALNEGP